MPQVVEVVNGTLITRLRFSLHSLTLFLEGIWFHSLPILLNIFCFLLFLCLIVLEKGNVVFVCRLNPRYATDSYGFLSYISQQLMLYKLRRTFMETF